MFVEFGDWISQPGPVPGGADHGASGQQLAAFSFVKDLAHFVRIAEVLGKDADAAYYEAQLELEVSLEEKKRVNVSSYDGMLSAQPSNVCGRARNLFSRGFPTREHIITCPPAASGDSGAI